MKNKIMLFCLVLSLLLVASVVMAALPADTILLEAEEATKMASGVKIVEKEGASGGKAIDPRPSAVATYEIDLPSAGDWYLWVRLFCPNGDADSLYVSMDKATPVPEDDKSPRRGVRIYSAPGDSVHKKEDAFNVWFWDAGKTAGERSYFKVKNAGKTNLHIIGREMGTLIDQIILTQDKDFNVEVALQGGPATK